MSVTNGIDKIPDNSNKMIKGEFKIGVVGK